MANPTRIDLALPHPAVLLPPQAAAHARAHPASPGAMVLGYSLWIASAGNLPLWRTLQSLGLLEGAHGWIFGVSLLLMLAAATALLLGLLSWRHTLKPAITLLLAVSAGGTYFMLAYGVVIDPTMLANVLQTDVHEAAALLNPGLIASMAAIAVAPAVLLWRTPLQYAPGLRQAGRNGLLVVLALALLAGLALASFQTLGSAMRNHKSLRYQMSPFNTLYALGTLATQSLRRGPMQLLPIGLDARPGSSYAAQAKPPLLVLVLGETGRSGNFGINGYGRNTTPELAREHLVSFGNAWSCGTSTAASVPCMFSHLDRDAFEARQNNFEGLLDVLQRAGLAVLWVDNQAGCKGVCDRVAHASTSSQTDPALCAGDGCMDETLLAQLDGRIAALPAERRARGVVVVLHQMGSHGPAYHARSPAAFKRFLPECTSNALHDCSRDAVVNAYDNSIAYTDHVLASTIGWLQARSRTADTAMVYVADHGESLGENNLYLHGMPYALAPDVQKHVPWITWLSPGFEERSTVHTDCLRRRETVRVSHDNYFHSVLGLMDVQTSAYQRDRDVYAPCAASTVAEAKKR